MIGCHYYLLVSTKTAGISAQNEPFWCDSRQDRRFFENLQYKLF